MNPGQSDNRKTMKTPQIEAAFDRIMSSCVFRLNGPEIDLPEALIQLGNAVEEEETDETTWSLGECLECDLGALIVGAYWALTEWHAGQSSSSYAALCSLGQVFSPGMTGGPEPESSELVAYELIHEWFEADTVN